MAIEQQVDFTDDRNIPKIRDIFPEPVKLEQLAEFRRDIKILSRLTIIYTNNSISHYMVSYTMGKIVEGQKGKIKRQQFKSKSPSPFRRILRI